MPSNEQSPVIAVFDLGGTWFRWGCYAVHQGLIDSQRTPAISYLSHPTLTAEELQGRMMDFVVRRTREMRDDGRELQAVSVSVGAAVNAHDETVLGSGPLWGPTAKPFQLQDHLRATLPELRWHVVNDITALLAPYMQDETAAKKTLLITVSTGIGARLYDHRSGRIPYDPRYGVQGEIGHLPLTFALEGRVIERQCECGGWNHLNAFSSGRGIAKILRDFGAFCADAPDVWEQVDDSYRLKTFSARLEEGSPAAMALLDALVAPLSRILATTLAIDPEIERIVLTGGVAHGLGGHYRESLQRTFGHEGLYQITEHDPHYLTRRLLWEEADDYGGLRGAGIYAGIHSRN